MTHKVALYVLLVGISVALLIDVTFAMRAAAEASRATLVEGTVERARAYGRRKSVKALEVDVVATDGEKLSAYAEFGSLSARWQFQDVPKTGERVTFYYLDDTRWFDAERAYGIKISEQSCSMLKLWYDIFGSYLHSGMSMFLYVIVMVLLCTLFKRIDGESVSTTASGFIFVYIVAKLLMWIFLF